MEGTAVGAFTAVARAWRRLRPALASALAAALAPALAAGLLAAASAAETAPELRGIPEVIDGDTLQLQGRRLHLTGVDAPELAQRCWLKTRLYDCGRVARTALLDLTAGVEVICRPLEPGTAERTFARCTAGGYDLSEGMAYTGWALADPDNADSDSADPESGDRYSREETRARAAGRGLWRGRFVAPWDWRRGARLAEESE